MLNKICDTAFPQGISANETDRGERLRLLRGPEPSLRHLYCAVPLGGDDHSQCLLNDGDPSSAFPLSPWFSWTSTKGIYVLAQEDLRKLMRVRKGPQNLGRTCSSCRYSTVYIAVARRIKKAPVRYPRGAKRSLMRSLERLAPMLAPAETLPQ